MYWHIDTDIVSLVVIVALYVYYRTQPLQDERALRDVRFLRCIETSIGITCIDIAASVIMEVPTTRFLYHVLMTAYFTTVELVIVEWFLYVLTILFEPEEKGGKTFRHIALTVYGAYALLALSNPWTGVIYALGPNGEYARGPLFALMLALYAAYTLILFLLILTRRKHIPAGYPGGVLLLTPVILALGIAAQLLVPGWLLIMPANMICLLLAFLFLQTMRGKDSRLQMENLSRAAETDPLTGLFNRSGMEMMAERTRTEEDGQGVLVLLVDIDDLKRVNDTMGHGEGDRAIRLVADTLREHFRASDTVVRYGGDEFLAFLTGSFTEAQMHRSIALLVTKLNLLAIGEKNDVPLRGSIGAAYGVVGRESFEELTSRADVALFHVKRHGKNGYAFYRPDMENEADA